MNNEQKAPPPVLLMASQVCPVLSVLGSLSSLSSQGLVVRLGYTSFIPPLSSTVLFFPVPGSTRTHVRTPFPWIHHPGLRSQERGGKGTAWTFQFGELGADSSGWLDTFLSSEAWSCCRRCAWPWLKW